MPQFYFEQSPTYLLKGFTQRETNEGKYLDQYVTYIHKQKTGSKLEHLNKKNIQLISCTIKKQKKKENKKKEGQI